MSPRYRIKVNGREFQVDVGDTESSPVQVTVDGVAYEVELPDRSPESRPVVRRAPSRPTPSAPPPAPASPASSGGDGAIIALLPGRIVSVAVKPGDSVASGQPVVVMESMKMEQTIASPRDGTVSRVAVEPGDTVAYGETLIEFE